MDMMGGVQNGSVAKNRYLPNLIAMKIFSSSLLVAFSLVRAQGDPKQVGNCVSGKIGFNPDRILNNLANFPTVDHTKFDMTIDFAPSNIVVGPNGVNLVLNKSRDGFSAPQGVKMSTTRYMHYGKFSFQLSGVPVSGVVTTFTTMSPGKDEINLEIKGPVARSNVFYKGIPEYGVWDAELPVQDVSQSHIYTIDWKRDSIVWSVDGVPLRIHSKFNATSPMTPPGEAWFPTTPSQIQISIWAGGQIDWANKDSFYSSFKSIEIQCYNEQDMPVKSWPPQPEGESIDFPAGDEDLSGTALSYIDQNGRIKFRNSASSATASFVVLLAIAAFGF